jgi:capsule biosynthesis phosphatase
MITEENVLVLDIDDTLCEKRREDESYIDVKPKIEMINRVKEYKNNGYYVILFTSRQMRTYKGNVGKINANTAKTLFEWLDKYDIIYDEIYFGKPWCGKNGFYVDDRAVRPREFLEYTHEEILELISKDKICEVKE